MLCTATIGGVIYKIVYEKGNTIIFTIKNGNEYYNVISNHPDMIKVIKNNKYCYCTCICAIRQKKKKMGNNTNFYTYDFYLQDLTV